MTRTDRAALKLAVAMAREESPARAQQIDGMLADTPCWEEVAAFASSCCQSHSLRLMPWQIAPCDLLPGDLNDPRQARGALAAHELLKRMTACGVSRWHPDPERACVEAERATAK